MVLTVGFYSIDLYLFLAVLATLWLLEWLILSLANRFVHRKRWLSTDHDLRKFLRVPVAAYALILAADIAITNLEPIVSRLYIVVMIWILMRAVKAVRTMAFFRFDSGQSDNLVARKVRTQMQFIERVISITLLFIGGALLLMTFNEARSLGRSLIASAGLAGVVIGFAAQKSLSTFVSGFQVAFTQPIRIDDVVIVEGEWGIVEEITLTYVVIKIWDLRRLIVPINYFTEKPIQNWTRTEANLLGFVLLNFDYSVNVADLRKKFLELLNVSKLWDKKVAAVHVTDATEKTIQVRFLMSARNSGDLFDLRCEIREKILAYIQQRAPQVLPQLRIHGPEV